MSAGISFDITGEARAIYRNAAAWHGLGKVFESKPGQRLTSDVAIREAGLGTTVEKRPIKTSDGIACPGYFATVEKESNRVLGIVGERYKVFQNSEAFAFLDSLVSDGIMEYESAFALNEGARIVLLARLPERDSILPGDTINRYLFLNTTHDGSGAISIIPTDLRVQCQNMADVVLASKNKARYNISIRHTDAMSDRLEAARDYILSVEDAFTEYADNCRLLADRKFSKDDAQEFISTLYPAPKEKVEEAFGAVAPASSKAATIHLNRLASLRDSFTHPSNNVEGMKGTWWQLFNAVSYDVDHNGRTRGRTERARRENRFLNVTEGPGAKLKAKAFTLALSMSA